MPMIIQQAPLGSLTRHRSDSCAGRLKLRVVQGAKLSKAPPRHSLPAAGNRVTSMSMAPFEFATANRLVFGRGAFKQLPGLVKDMVDACQAKGVLLVTGASSRFSDPLEALLAEQGMITRTIHVSGEPDVDTIITAIAGAKDGACGTVVAVGGGSAIDTGKAVAALITNGGAKPDPYDFLEVVGRGKAITVPSAPFIAVPTTAGPGAEVTRNAVIGAGDRKVSIRSPHMLPDVALVDPDLTLALPPSVTAHTGLDALVQCIEPYVSNKANPITDALALQGMERGARSLRAAYKNGADDPEAREGMCVCSLLGGLALANSKLGAVHGFAGVIGGMFPAPHGAVCAALLVPATKMNLDVLGSLAEGGDATAKGYLAKYTTVARTLTSDALATPSDGLAWMEDLVSDLGVPGLSAYGMEEQHVRDVCEKSAVASSMQGNPCKLTVEQLEVVLRGAM